MKHHKEREMKEIPSYALPNGFTFLAVTSSDRGVWAKATDPVTAARNAHRDAGGKKNAIYVVFGKYDELRVSNFGGYGWKLGNPPVPIGLFTVTDRSIRPVAKGDFNEEHGDCLEWMTDQIEDIELDEASK
jgi:hypothetical protein